MNNKIDFQTVLKDFDNNPVLSPDKKDLTLGFICQNALMHTERNSPLSGPDHLKRFNLALKTTEREPQELTSEDKVLIKECVAKLYSPLVYGRVNEILK